MISMRASIPHPTVKVIHDLLLRRVVPEAVSHTVDARSFPLKTIKVPIRVSRKVICRWSESAITLAASQVINGDIIGRVALKQQSQLPMLNGLLREALSDACPDASQGHEVCPVVVGGGGAKSGARLAEGEDVQRMALDHNIVQNLHRQALEGGKLRRGMQFCLGSDRFLIFGRSGGGVV
jgi:hypothetical protein